MWVALSIAWAGFYGALAVMDLVNGTPSSWGIFTVLAFAPPVLLGVVLGVIVWIAGGFRR